MPDPEPPHLTDDTRVGPDVDLEKDDVRLQEGSRITSGVADDLVEEIRRTSGRSASR